jgi:ASC-1-like (ASCH) protein
MDTWYSNLENCYYETIKNGKKIYELLLDDSKRIQIKIGHYWIFNGDLKTQVLAIYHFETFREAIKYVLLYSI